MRKAFSTRTLVRNLLEAHGDVLRKSEVRDLIGLSGDKGYARVNNAVNDLVKTGELERTHYGRYRWTGKVPDAEYCKSQNRMWRFMWIRTKKSKPFTVRNIHELGDVALYTAKRYVTFLVKSSYLEKVGKKRAYKTSAPLYLIVSDKMKDDVPLMRRQRTTVQIEKHLAETRKLAAQFFKTADTKPETLQGLLETAQKMCELLESCKEIAFSLRKTKAKDN